MSSSRLRPARVIAVLTLVLATSWLVIACKQQEGERCQVTEDCSDNLVCNQATQECSTTTGGGIDATVPDGPPPDAAVDAMIDAAIDAMIDAS